MKPTFTKVDANTLQITTDVTPQQVVATYVYDDLVTILADLQSQKDAFNVDIDQKIADAQANVDAANTLGIVAVTEIAQPISQISVK